MRKDGILNKQEATIKIVDSETLGVIHFENNLLDDKKYCITSYPILEHEF